MITPDQANSLYSNSSRLPAQDATTVQDLVTAEFDQGFDSNGDIVFIARTNPDAVNENKADVDNALSSGLSILTTDDFNALSELANDYYSGIIPYASGQSSNASGAPTQVVAAGSGSMGGIAMLALIGIGLWFFSSRK